MNVDILQCQRDDRIAFVAGAHADGTNLGLKMRNKDWDWDGENIFISFCRCVDVEQLL